MTDKVGDWEEVPKGDEWEDVPGSKPKAQPSFTGSAAQAARGALESIPFVGEKFAESAELPKPKTFTERLTRRAARNLPPALLLGSTGVGAIPAALGYFGSVGLGQLAEEVGVPEEYQPVAEVAGAGAGAAAKNIAGRMTGYIEPQLEKLSAAAKRSGYEIGPEARSAAGMKYGMGPDPQSAIRNAEKFTQEATRRAGNEAKVVDAAWVNQTGKQLGNEVNQIFAGRTFQTTPEANAELQRIVNQAEGIFGQQGNIARTIIEKNIGGQRTRGQLMSPSFAASDLRGAIEAVNVSLNGAKGPQAKLLHDLKDTLENLAESNLSAQAARAYSDWRKKYNSFATIRDAIQREGSTGITKAGQVNPEGLLNVITSRTGGDATRSPLYQDLAIYGDILKHKTVPPSGALKSAIAEITESPITKALKTGIQPRVPTEAQKMATRAQIASPLQQYTQMKGEQ